MRLSGLLANLFALVALSGCTSFQLSDFRADITLPASGDCYGFNVISDREERIPADDPVCIRRKARSIRLDADNWKILRRDIQNNCQTAKCTQIKGALDDLFLTIDRALDQIPTP